MSAPTYPLHWPANWPRARSRRQANFHERTTSGQKSLSIATAMDRLEDELTKLGAKEIVVSTNRERRVNGMINAAGSEPADPGVAVYFQLEGKDTALACDAWDRVADNVNAIAKHIEALRGQERWGVGTIEQAFTGYQALPAPEQWWQVLGLPQNASRDAITQAYRDRAKVAHPDHAGGSEAAMARLNAARDQALEQRP